MNSDTLKGNWKQFSGKVQKEWGKLTNDDLDVIKGDSKILAGKIQERYGIARDEAESQVNQWYDTWSAEECATDSCSTDKKAS